MKWPRFNEEFENEDQIDDVASHGDSKEDGSTADEIRELEEIEDEENEYDPDDAAEKMSLLTANKPWVQDIRPEKDRVVMVLGLGAPDSEKLPYEIDGVPIEIIQGKD